jgi:2-haloacid dehalogenase
LGHCGIGHQPSVPARPVVVAFDVIGTLFSLDSLRTRLEAAGLSDVLDLWFTRLLRDGMALSLAGSYASFSQVAPAALEVVSAQRGVDLSSERVERVMAGFAALEPHPDVRPALETLGDAEVRMIALTNGGADSTIGLLERAGLVGFFERVVSVDEVRAWKPGPLPYRHAAALCAVPPAAMALVSVHGWDVHGARAAGLVTGWAARLECRWPASLRHPDVTGDKLTGVVDALLAL